MKMLHLHITIFFHYHTVPICKTPPKIDYGEITRVGNIRVQYSCQNGYVLQGNAERKCNEEKRWTGQEPYCLPVNSIGNNILVVSLEYY